MSLKGLKKLVALNRFQSIFPLSSNCNDAPPSIFRAIHMGHNMGEASCICEKYRPTSACAVRAG